MVNKMLFNRRSDYDISLDKDLVEMLSELKIATVGQLRFEYRRRKGKLISWITIKKHVENLVLLNKIEEFSRSGNERKRIIQYKLI